MVRPEKPLVPVSHDLFPLASAGFVEEGLAEVTELLALFSQLTDPRRARGVRHRVASILTVLVFAALAGVKTFREAGDRVAGLPAVLLAAACTRTDPRSGVAVPPSRDTIRRVVEDLDAQAADLLAGRWIADRARGVRACDDPGAAGLAIDGKAVRNSGSGYADVKLSSAMVHGQAVLTPTSALPRRSWPRSGTWPSRSSAWRESPGSLEPASVSPPTEPRILPLLAASRP